MQGRVRLFAHGKNGPELLPIPRTSISELLQAACWEGLSTQLVYVKCMALLWKSNLADDLLHPGMLPLTSYVDSCVGRPRRCLNMVVEELRTGLPLRSLLCGKQDQEAHFVWEDAW